MQNNINLSVDQLKQTIEKMIKIVKADTGASELYRDMLLSMIPNSNHKVNMSYWCYKADRDDFETMLKLQILSNTDIIFEYENLLQPYKEELMKYSNS
jgi:hypothetical protein